MTDKATILAAYWMKSQLDRFIKDHKSELTKELGPGDSSSARFDLDGQELPLGKITRTEPRPAWKIKDAEALIAWAKTNRPELVDYVAVLDDEKSKALLKHITRENAAVTEEGEVIPGIEWDNDGGSYLRYYPAKDMADKLSLLSREGLLQGLMDGVLELESGQQ